MFGEGRLLPQQGDEVLGCHLDAPLSGQRDPLVWRAWRASDARDVVVKLVPREQVSLMTARLVSGQARMLAALAPPSAAAVIEAADLGSHLVLVARLAPGEELGRCLRAEGAWEVGQAVAVVAQLAACLDEVHRAGLVHGRIDPRHVRVSGAGEARTVTLVELGLRRRGRAAGPYADFEAPEVRFGDAPTVASDVYSLAALLHLMLTGEPPRDHLGSLAELAHGERGRVLAIARLGLARSPADRPPGVRALADAAAVALEVAGSRAGSAMPDADRLAEQPRIVREELERRGGEETPALRPVRAPLTGARRSVPRGALVAAAAVTVPIVAVLAGALGGVEDSGPRAGSIVDGSESGAASAQPAPGAATSPVEIVGRAAGPRWGLVRPGQAGSPVSAIQWLLYAVGAGPLPDGVFDATTEQRVKDFQVVADVPVTGAVDGPTWGALAEPLAVGDRGPRVRALQLLLRVQQRLRVDGAYDERTSAAVAAFQRDTGLRATGDADVATWAALSRAWE